jgi:hypothetical protein
VFVFRKEKKSGPFNLDVPVAICELDIDDLFEEFILIVPGLSVFAPSYVLHRNAHQAYFGLFKMISAAITPGIQAHRVSMNTINTLPHPLSITARGGKMIERSTRQKLIFILDFELAKVVNLFHMM